MHRLIQAIVILCMMLAAFFGFMLVNKGDYIEAVDTLPAKRTELKKRYRELTDSLKQLQNQLNDSRKLMRFLNTLNQLATHDYKVGGEINYFQKVGDQEVADLLTKLGNIIEKNSLETFFPFEENKVNESKWTTAQLENLLHKLLKLTEQISLYKFKET